MHIMASEVLHEGEGRRGKDWHSQWPCLWTSVSATDATIARAPVSMVWLGCTIPVGPQVVLGGVEAEESME